MEIMRVAVENEMKSSDLAEEENAEKFLAKNSNEMFTALPKPLIWDSSGNILFNEDSKTLSRSSSTRSVQHTSNFMTEYRVVRDARFQRSLFGRKKSASFSEQRINAELRYNLLGKTENRDRSRSGNLPVSNQKSEEMSKLKNLDSTDGSYEELSRKFIDTQSNGHHANGQNELKDKLILQLNGLKESNVYSVTNSAPTTPGQLVAPPALDKLAGETDEDAKVRKEALIARDRTRNSTVVQIPSASIQMDLHTLYLDRINQQNKGTPGSPKSRSAAIITDEENQKKNGGTFALIKQKLKREDSLSGNNEVDDFRGLLAHIRSNLCETSEHDLSVYKGSHWSTVNSGNVVSSNEQVDNERFEALWELFYAEITYLMDHLIVLNDVFAKQLQHAKSFGFLTEVNESTLFANLDSLIDVTSEFARRLIKIFQDCQSVLTTSTKNIVETFKEFDKLLTPQYNEYCLNYQKAKSHLEVLKRSEMFIVFVKWCEQDVRCQRLRLEDFLVAPLQHLTKYPLLLKAIRKRTPNHDKNTFLLTTTIINIENSIKSIEKKYSALVNLQRIQEIHESLAWPVIVDVDKTCYLPESVKNILANSHCGDIMMNPNRVLLQEGTLTLADNNKTEFYTFLFDDMLMFTKFRKKNKRRSGSASEELRSTDMSKRRIAAWETISAQYTVYKQPIPLDRLRLYNCDEQSLPVKNAFCILHYNRYHQPVSAYTLLASSPEEKKNWMKNIEEAADRANIEIANSTKEHSSDEEYML